MRELIVLSGKGGVGKTSVTAALAATAARQGPIALADADVDAANLALVVPHTPGERQRIGGGQRLAVDADRCLGCLACVAACRFGALAAGVDALGMPVVRVDDLACEGCGACTHRCPAGALHLEPCAIGTLFHDHHPAGPLTHARLDAGGENSGHLVAAVRQAARAASRQAGISDLLVDGPPGIGCPVISACSGADGVILVSEPGPSAAHDAHRLLDLADHFRLPVVAVINRCDVDAGAAADLAADFERRGVPVLARLPRHVAWRQAQDQAVSVVAIHPGLRGVFASLWGRIRNHFSLSLQESRS